MAAAKIRIDVAYADDAYFVDLTVNAAGRKWIAEGQDSATLEASVKKALKVAAAFGCDEKCVFIEGVKLTTFEKKEVAKSAQ